MAKPKNSKIVKMLMCVGVSCQHTPAMFLWEIDFNSTDDRGRVDVLKFPALRSHITTSRVHSFAQTISTSITLIF
jgi:hypothetical protein